MKPEGRYLKFVRWSEEDRTCVGYCLDLFPWGGVCHGLTEEAASHKLRHLVREEVMQLDCKRQVLGESLQALDRLFVFFVAKHLR